MLQKSGYDVANEIRMSKHNGSFLVLEGYRDVKLLNKFKDPSCSLIISTSKESLLESHDILVKDNYSRALFLSDADFDNIKGLNPKTQFHLQTDLHDFENIMMSSSAFDDMMKEIGIISKIDDFEAKSGKRVIEHVYDIAKIIGFFRFESLNQGLEIDFDKLKFEKLIDKDTFNLLDDELLIQIKSNRNIIIKGIDCEELLDRAKNTPLPPMQLSCGHDLLNILAMGLKKIIGTYSAKEMNNEEISKHLRLAYSSSHLIKNKIYSDIKKWETTNKPHKIII